ncbi:hypothetical protein [Aeromonas sp. Marseille-Q7275]
MWVGYALASDYPADIKKIALTSGYSSLAPAPSIFVDPQDNIFLWHFMFNQVQDLPEMLTAGKEREYLNFIFDHLSYQRDRVAAQTYIDAYSSRRTGRLRVLPPDLQTLHKINSGEKNC